MVGSLKTEDKSEDDIKSIKMWSSPEMTNFIKVTAAGIVKSVIDAILVRAAKYDAILANAAAQKKKECKEYLDMQERKAQGRCGRPHVAGKFCIYLGVVRQ